MKGDFAAYDESFHNGLNIICGENAKGKTTILDLIFYALGGTLTAWYAEPLQCDWVFSEVLFNGKCHTLRREIREHGEIPIEISELTMDEAIEQNNWSSLPRDRSKNKVSFSQYFFRLLGYPDAQDDTDSNLTINQILRLIYVDQNTSPDKVVKQEEYDIEARREAIGNLLLGLDSFSIFRLRLQIKEARKKIDQLNGELNSSSKFRNNTGFTSLQQLEQKRNALEDQKGKLVAFLNDQSKKEVQLTNQAVTIDDLRLEKISVSRGFANLTEKKQQLSYQLSDTISFLKSLVWKRTSLEESRLTRESLGSIPFEVCPSCLQETEQSDIKDLCILCGKPKPSNDNDRYLRLFTETEYQLRESKKILDEIESNLEQTENKLAEYRKKQELINGKIHRFEQQFSFQNAKLLEAAEKLGSIDKELVDLEKLSAFFDLDQKKLTKLKQLKENKDGLQKNLNEELANSEELKSEIEQELSGIILKLLKKDLLVDDSFPKAKNFEFNIAKNRLSVDGKRKFSASSQVFLKSIFFLGMLKLSLQRAELGFPRFILLDSFENGGMAPDRSSNNQLIVKELCEEFKNVQHQVILTTSNVRDDLKNSAFQVGKYYIGDLRTLNLDPGQ